MGILDDIKNMKPLSEHKWTLKELLKIEKKLLKKGQKSILKQLMKKDNIKFTSKDKPVVIDFNKLENCYYKNNPIHQREKVEQDGDNERRNVIG